MCRWPAAGAVTAQGLGQPAAFQGTEQAGKMGAGLGEANGRQSSAFCSVNWVGQDTQGGTELPELRVTGKRIVLRGGATP